MKRRRLSSGSGAKKETAGPAGRKSETFRRNVSTKREEKFAGAAHAAVASGLMPLKRAQAGQKGF
jgi:hypothetical protein